MDPVQKMWLYHQWLGDHRDDTELAKNHAYLLGSFSNPEAVKQMMGDNKHESTDDDFEESLKMVTDTDMRSIKIQEPTIGGRKKRRRAKIKE